MKESKKKKKKKKKNEKYCQLWSIFGLVGFYGISTVVGYLMPNNQFHLKQFSLAWVHSLNLRTVCQKHIYFKQFSLIKQFSLA